MCFDWEWIQGEILEVSILYHFTKPILLIVNSVTNVSWLKNTRENLRFHKIYEGSARILKIFIWFPGFFQWVNCRNCVGFNSCEKPCEREETSPKETQQFSSGNLHFAFLYVPFIYMIHFSCIWSFNDPDAIFLCQKQKQLYCIVYLGTHIRLTYTECINNFYKSPFVNHYLTIFFIIWSSSWV